ncbi:rhamnan synthesis F family protein [Lichenicoccus sp.]|uniref:rhamnan synthesis F family protein n=1 Tax=Lichenicoccus sp. TaxID=2781899 RepID=UPI003D1097DC
MLSDLRVIIDSGIFNIGLASDINRGNWTLQQAIVDYLKKSRAVVPRRRTRTGWSVRRPTEGFHPMIYAEDCVDYDEGLGEDPLAHYIRSGSPQGRWTHPVMRLRSRQDPPKPSALRILLHCHFFYPELLPDFLRRTRRNSTTFDLIITTTNQRDARLLALDAPENCEIRVVPNRGRDIGAMITGLGASTLESYDIIGHIHSKKSPQYDASFGERWRNFLWEQLLGGEYPVVDHVMEAFEDDKQLGLVFAEDPHLNDWDHNNDVVHDLAPRMGLPKALPQHFDFPIGNMFWCRAAALHPLLRLDLTWDSYPTEPLPVDGTIIHTIERLLPFLAASRGLSYATTYVDGCRR